MKYSAIIEVASKGYKGYAVNKGIFSPGSKCYIEVVALNGVGGNNQRRFLERNFISLLFLKRTARSSSSFSRKRESIIYLKSFSRALPVVFLWRRGPQILYPELIKAPSCALSRYSLARGNPLKAPALLFPRKREPIKSSSPALFF
jgi:hypothetical protein